MGQGHITCLGLCCISHRIDKVAVTCSILDQLILMLKGNAPVVPWGAPVKDVQGDVCHVVVLGLPQVM